MTHIPFIPEIIGGISLLLALMGIIIITIGSFKSAWLYICNGSSRFPEIRLSFSRHLIIGLDFFVGKDIIDTMLINTDEQFIEEVIMLIIVVFIRVVLTLMAERELETVKRDKKNKL